MRLLTSIRLAAACIALLALSSGSQTVLFAQDWFKPQLSPSDWTSPELLKPRLKALAGSKAVNCGYASSQRLKATDVSDCALQAYASRKSFYARYDLPGIDTLIVLGFAFDGRKLYAVTWPKWGMGWQGRPLDVKDCPTPVTLRKAKSDRLNCFPSDPIAD